MSPIADARYALRLLARSPIFALTSIASLAIGIAASTTIFSLADALLLRPAAGISRPSEVVDIGRRNTDEPMFDNMSHVAFVNMQQHQTTLTGMSTVDFGGTMMSLVEDGASEKVNASLVSASYFDILGTRAALGRFFLPDEDVVPGEKPVVVLAYDFWQRRFGGDPDILSRPLRLNGHDFTVVGVAASDFKGLTFVGTDLWVPTAMVAVVRGAGNSNLLTEPGNVWHVAVGRLKPGVSVEQAQAELESLNEAYKQQEPRANPQHHIVVARTGRIPPPVRVPFTAFVGFLFVLTGALVAIACSNVAGMLLARAAARQREMATRLAVGASRGRLIAQLLTETMLLFAFAGIVAVPLTMWFTWGFEGFLPALPVSINLDLSIDLRAMMFAAGLSIVTALVFGLAPARQAVGGSLAQALHGANATADRRRLRVRHALVIAQIALSLMLVATAGLFIRTLRNVAFTDPGYRMENVYLANVDVALSGYRDAAATALVDRFMERLSALSGVESVSAARMIPLQGSSFGLGRVRAPGSQGGVRGTDEIEADWNVITPRYFETVGMALVEGRDFADADRDGAPLVGIVNETFARAAWPGRSAVGQRITQEYERDKTRDIEIVGVAADAKYRYFSDPPTPFLFVPMAQQPQSDMTLFVKHAAGMSPGRDVRTAIAQVEPTVAVIVAQSFTEAAAVGLIPQRLAAWIAGGVGSLGVFLAALGLYGLMAFIVAQRTREIAIRMALGASSGSVQSMVMRQAARLGAWGGALGVALAAGVGLLVQVLLVDVPPIDPIALGVTSAIFAVVLAAACWTPARRAASTEPAAALRAE